MKEFIYEFWVYLNISAPYLLLGFFVGGILHVYLTVEKVEKYLGGNKVWGVAKAALVGIPLPLCSCGVIPAAVSLKKNGANNGVTSAFLISTPENGVDSMAMTYAMMDLPMLILRPVAGFFSAFVAGVLQLWKNDVPNVKIEMAKSCCQKNKIEDKKNIRQKFISGMKYGFYDLVNDLALWLFIGLIIGAMINFLIPENFLQSFGPHLSRLFILLIGIPLYICASATTPIAAALVLKGLSPGSALLLLLVGPATNMANLIIIQKYIGKKGVIINVFSVAIVGLIFSYIADFLYFYFNLPTNFKISHFHGEEISAFSEICALILLTLIAKGIWVENLWPKLKKTSNAQDHIH
jgi:uncharacterized membrane protein YraQ (UPF0718 family)